ncbi:MAG: LysR family transcriptional regulator [Verrucomicrobiaceae bacterium]|nr:LysR family transcriptional regulator [Verrucomicrobiaceae bacterium]
MANPVQPHRPIYLNRLTLRQIQVFLTVTRLNSYSRAAEELALTQPAVSAQIRQLEDVVGEPVFDYLGKQLYLTPVGQALQRTGRDLMQRLIALEMEIAGLRGVMQGTLTLAIESSAQHFMPGELAAFCAEHPAVNIALEVVNHSAALHRLRENFDDLVVMGQVPADRALTFIPFRDNELIAVAPPSHRFADGTEITLLQLAEEVLLVREVGSGTRKAFDTYCLQQSVVFPRRQQLGSLEAIKHGVHAGLGVAVLPREMCARELQESELCALNVRGLPLRRSWCVVYPRGKNLTPVASAFLKHLTGT